MSLVCSILASAAAADERSRGKTSDLQSRDGKSAAWQEFDERIMFPINVHRGIMFLKLICEGGHYAGKNHGLAYIAL